MITDAQRQQYLTTQQAKRSRCRSLRLCVFCMKRRTRSKRATCCFCSDNAKQYAERARLKGHGLSEVDHAKLLKMQQGLCAICMNAPRGKRKKLAIDHDHDTDRVRGLLCDSCNVGLGHFKDCVLLLEAAIEYLQRNNQE